MNTFKDINSNNVFSSEAVKDTKEDNTETLEKEVKSLNSQIEGLENQIFSYKLSELNELNEKMKDLIVICSRLAFEYSMSDSNEICLSRINGSTVEDFVGDSICVINRLRNVISNNIDSYSVTDVYNNKQYVEVMQDCLENLFVLLGQESDLNNNMRDWVDAGHSLGKDEIAIEEFSVASDYAKDIITKLYHSYWNSFQWCREMIESVNKEVHYVTC